MFGEREKYSYLCKTLYIKDESMKRLIFILILISSILWYAPKGSAAWAGTANYVRTNGTSYFDTGYVPDYSTRVELRCVMNVGAPSDGVLALMGCYKDGVQAGGSSRTSGLAMYFNSGGYYVTAGSYNEHYGSLALTSGMALNVSMERGSFKITDDVTGASYGSSFWSSSGSIECGKKTLYLGAINNLSGGQKADVSILECKIYEFSTLVHHFMPARYDDAFGMYDMVTDAFAPMKGSGATGEVSRSDCQHRMVAEVETNGNNTYEYSHCHVCDLRTYKHNYIRTNGTAYLNTGFIPDNNTMVSVKYQLNSLDASNNDCIFGTSTDWPAQDAFGVYTDKYNSGLQMGFGNGLITVPDIQLTTDYPYEITAKRNMIVADRLAAPVKNVHVEKTFSNESSDPATEPLVIGASMLNGKLHYASDIKIYSFTIMQNGVQVHNYIPGKFHGVYGMYDTVTEQFLPMHGTGATGSTEEVTCTHKYYTVEDANGINGKHCFICDSHTYNSTFYKVVHFDKNSDTAYGTMNDLRVDGNGPLSPNQFTSNYYTFKGWNTKPDGTGQQYADGGKIIATVSDHGNVTLYAQWQPLFMVNGAKYELTSANTSQIDIIDDGINGYGAAYAFKADKASYTYTVNTQNEWGTLCLPFAFKSDGTFRMYTPAEVEGNNMILTETDEAQAGVPVVFRKADKSAATITVTTQNATMLPQPEAQSAAGSSLMLHGTFITDNNILCQSDRQYFVIINDVFYRVDSNIVLKPYRAYFTMPSSAAARSRLYIQDSATGIQDVTSGDSHEPSLYNLNGQRVSSKVNGIIIINGKKYIK